MNMNRKDFLRTRGRTVLLILLSFKRPFVSEAGSDLSSRGLREEEMKL